MNDFEKELDKTIANAKATIAQTEALADAAKKAVVERDEWMKENNIPADFMNKLMSKLTPEEQKTAQAEQERYYRNLKFDLDASVEGMKTSQSPSRAGGRRVRNRV